MSGGGMTDAKAFAAQKLAVADLIRHDGALSMSYRMVGVEICSLTNFQTGFAWASEGYLAEKLTVTPRTIKRAIVALRDAGYIEIEKVGRNNRYRPVFAVLEKVTECPLSETQTVTECPLSAPDRGHLERQQGTFATENRGHQCPPISLEISLGISARAEAAAVGAPDGAAGPPSFDLGLPGVALRERIGEAEFRSWLGKVAFVGVSGDELVLQAETKFRADELQKRYADKILAAWRIQYAGISRLTVQVAPATISGARKARGDPDIDWLAREGVAIVADRCRMERKAAAKQLDEWRNRCGRDAKGLRRIITEADAQGLVEDQFRNLVKVSTKALRHADQVPLPLGPVAVKRRA